MITIWQNMMNWAFPVCFINIYKCLAIFAAVSFYEFTRKFQYTIFQYSEKIRFGKFGERENKSCDVFFWQKSRFLFFSGEIGIVTCKKNGTKGTKGSWSWTSNWRPFTAGNPCSEEQDWEQCLALSTTWGENSVLGERMTNGDGGICISSLAVPTNTLHQSPQILCISSSPHKYSVPARM